ncbi:MAG: Holliday junction resolvasome RuvABC DNA-binding subunit, partial [Planctomycetota bacterium]
SIGYSDKEAAKSVEKAVKDVGDDDLEALVRAAMRA